MGARLNLRSRVEVLLVGVACDGEFGGSGQLELDLKISCGVGPLARHR